MAIINKIEPHENDLRQLETEESNVQNSISPTTYADRNIMSALRKFTPIELQSIEQNLPSKIVALTSEEAEDRSPTITTNSFLDREVLVSNVDTIDSSELINKIVGGQSFSTNNLVSLAENRTIESNNFVDNEASISHFNYGCCCPSCGGNFSPTPDILSNKLSLGSSVSLRPPPDDDPPPLPVPDDPANEVYAALYEVADLFRPLWLPDGYRLWNNYIGQPVTVTYSFLQSVPSYYDDDAKERNNFAPFTPEQMDGARRALQYVSELTRLGFKEVSGVGQIAFGTYTMEEGVGGHADYPGEEDMTIDEVGAGDGGDVWLDNESGSANFDQSIGSKGFRRMLHEIGHAMGLKHPGAYNAGSGDDVPPPPYLPSSLDNRQNTLMSYNDHPFSQAEPQSYLVYDIAALQFFYGPNMETRKGDDTYRWDANTAFIEAIWDAGGIDTIDASNQVLPVSIGLYDGGFSSIGPDANFSSNRTTNNLAIAFGATIENARGGAGNDFILGNETKNTLDGGAGDDDIDGKESDDTIYGGTENDDLYGGDGDDSLYGEAGQDFLYGGEDNDTLDGGADNDYLAGYAGNDTLNGSTGSDELYGAEGDDRLYGGGEDDIIEGYSGSDTLEGADGNDTLNGGSEIDTLYGGSGDDALDGGSGGDVLYGGDDNDTLYGGDDVDTLYGDANDDTIEGGSGNDLIFGGDGNDRLSDLGGGDDIIFGEAGEDIINGLSGIDYLYGGEDDDRLYGSFNDDYLFDEAFGESIISDDFFEGGSGNDTLDGGGGNDVLNGDSDLGADGNDTIYGGSGDDILDGDENVFDGGIDYLDGGIDNDTLSAGGGDDTIIGGSGIDTLVENFASNFILSDTQLVGLGTDRLDGIEIARLVTGNGDNLIDASGFSGSVILNGGSGHDNLYGAFGDDALVGGSDADSNDRWDYIRGGNGNDSIEGGYDNDYLYGEANNDTLNGGFGSDYLEGGSEDDIYLADSLDTIVELANGGNDLIRSDSLTTLSDNVEKLERLNPEDTTTVSLTGNAIANEITGNAGNNVINGLAGDDILNGLEGSDTLYGGDNNDTLNGGSGDDTLDGGTGIDRIVESGDLFAFDLRDSFLRSYELNADATQFTETDRLLESDELNLNATQLVETDTLANIENATLTGGEGDNNLYAYYFTMGSVFLFGNGGIDVLNGGSGDDTLEGGSGNDTLGGHAGNDTLKGGIGSDLLGGGAGNDILVGGDAANDAFGFSGTSPFTRFEKTLVDPKIGIDRIEDFGKEDTIVLDKTVFNGLQSNGGIGFTVFGFSVASEFAIVSSDVEVATSRGLIVYSKATGNLFYNQNSTNPDLGSGGLFATLTNKSELTPEDFCLIV